MAVIEIANVWKQFHLQTQRSRTLKEFLVSSVRPGTAAVPVEPFWALRDISFEIEQGETFGIIGDNGSGKSTLLKLITGISKPTKGHVGVRGNVSALLELGAGFHPDFTGRENIFLNGAILGLRRREIEQRFESIVSFAELERFIDNPVKTYSSGMYMRLAFAIAVHVDPDILVIDEVLAVGDVPFQQKCFDQIHRFKHSGKTIVFVSHALPTVQELCQRSAWIHKGDLKALGSTQTVLDFYSQQIAATIDKNKQEAEVLVPDGRATLRNLKALDGKGLETSIHRFGEPARFDVELHSQMSPHQLDLFVRILRADGVCCYDVRTSVASFAEAVSDGPISLLIPELRLHAGTYSLHLCVTETGSERWLDEKFFNFAVDSPYSGPGVAVLEANWMQRRDRNPANTR